MDGHVKGVRRRALEMGRGNITGGNRLQEWGLCNLEGRRLKGQHTVEHKWSFLPRLAVTKHRTKVLN